MKIPEWMREIILHLGLILLYATFLVGFSGCDSDDEGWEGTWSLDTINDRSLEQRFLESWKISRDVNTYAGDGQILEQHEESAEIDISVFTSSWTFYQDEWWEVEIALEFEAKWQDSKIPMKFLTQTTGTYSLSGEIYTLTIAEGLVDRDGIVSDADMIDIGTGFRREYERGLSPGLMVWGSDTGTWFKEGDTLTLTNEDKEVVVVFRQK